MTDHEREQLGQRIRERLAALRRPPPPRVTDEQRREWAKLGCLATAE